MRLRGSGAKKIVSEVSNMLNQAVGYGDKQTSWGPTLLLKVRGLAHYLIGKNKELDIVSPEFGGQRVDSHEILRYRILNR